MRHVTLSLDPLDALVARPSMRSGGDQHQLNHLGDDVAAKVVLNDRGLRAGVGEPVFASEDNDAAYLLDAASVAVFDRVAGRFFAAVDRVRHRRVLDGEAPIVDDDRRNTERGEFGARHFRCARGGRGNDNGDTGEMQSTHGASVTPKGGASPALNDARRRREQT